MFSKAGKLYGARFLPQLQKFMSYETLHFYRLSGSMLSMYFPTHRLRPLLAVLMSQTMKNDLSANNLGVHSLDREKERRELIGRFPNALT